MIGTEHLYDVLNNLPSAATLDGTEKASVIQNGALVETTTQGIANLGGGGGSSILTKTITINDSDFKTLPSTAIEIIPAPGVGKIILPISFYAKLNASAGQYTNLDPASNVLNIGWGDSSGAFVDNMMYITFSFIETLTTDWTIGGIFGFISANMYDAVQAVETGERNVENTALVVGAYNSLGNFTGGNVTNIFKLTVVYMILDA